MVKKEVILNIKGQCPICDRKPLIYKKDQIYYCTRCDRAFDLNTKKMIENYFWNSDGTPKSTKVNSPSDEGKCECQKPKEACSNCLLLNDEEKSGNCMWCGELYNKHLDSRDPNEAVPRVPCTLLKSGFLTKSTPPQKSDDSSQNENLSNSIEKQLKNDHLFKALDAMIREDYRATPMRADSIMRSVFFITKNLVELEQRRCLEILKQHSPDDEDIEDAMRSGIEGIIEMARHWRKHSNEAKQKIINNNENG